MSIKQLLIIKKIILVFVTALAIVSVIQGCRNAANYSQDFQWDAAKVMSLGMNPYDESLNPSSELTGLGFEEYYKQMEANQFPSLLFLLYPYVILPPLLARYAWLVSNLIFTVLILFFLRKTFLQKMEAIDYGIVAGLMLAGMPWRNQMGVGQHTLFALCFFLAAVYVSERFKNSKLGFVGAGFLLSVSFFKYTLTAPLALYYIYKRRYKELVVSVIPHIILTGVAALYLKDSYLNMIIKPLKVASVLTSEGSMDIGSVLGGGYFTMIITLAVMAVLLVVTYLLGMKKNTGDAGDLGMGVKNPNFSQTDVMVISMLTMWSMIITYHRIYDYFVLIIPFGMFLNKKIEEMNRTEIFGLAIYSALVFAVFFVLRIISNNGESNLFVAVFYYAITIWITGLCLKKLRNRNNE